LAGPPAAAWLSAVWVGGLFSEGCAMWDEPDSETSAHPACTKTNKDEASRHPNQILFCRATMVAPSLTVTVRVSYSNQRTAHRDTIPTSRPDTRSNMPSICPDQGVCRSRFKPLSHLLGPPGPSTVRSSATEALKTAFKASWSSDEDAERGSDDDPIPQDLAKYRPHRPHQR
jgi:hypothetical protein